MKKLIALLLAAVMVLGLVACGPKEPAASTGDNANKTDDGKIAIGGQLTEENIAAGGNDAATPEKEETPVEEKTAGGILTFSYGTPTTRAWYDVRSIMAVAGMAFIYETPCRYDAHGDPEPFLLESATPDADALTWTLKVRDGIYFSDGSKLDAEAMAWNLDYYKMKGVLGNSFFKNYINAEVVDDMTVVCHFSAWDALFDYSLCRTVLIASKKAFDEHGEEWLNENPVGTGPFVQKVFNADVNWELEKNPNYWQGEVLLDGINSVTYSQALVAAQALNMGEIQMQLTEDYTLVEQMRDFQGMTAHAAALPSYYYTLCFNMKEGDPFADVRVRKAVSYAIDVDTILETLTFGYAIKTNQWATKGSRFYNDDVVGQEYDMEKAKQLLAEAGYPDGFKTQITVSANVMINSIAQIIVESLAQLGIDCEINQVEGAAWTTKIGDWDTGMFIHQMGAEAGAASQYSTTFYEYEGFGLGSGSFVIPEELDKVTTSITTSKTSEELAQNAKTVAKMVVDDYCMMKVMFGSQAITFVRNEVHDCNYAVIQNLRTDFWETWIEQ